jgi:hypothetical protein
MRLRLLALAAVLVVVAAVTGVLVACSQAPTEVQVRTFERAARTDVVCLQIYDPSNPNTPVPFGDGPHPVPEQQCAPVAVGGNGSGLYNQLFALVTQTTRGELAVVDLSSGIIQDQRLAIPGINFVPVGGLPSDVAVTPDGFMAFVGAAEVNKPAIYGVPTYRLLGDSPGFNTAPLTLPELPVCALPQNPGSLSVVPRLAAAQGADAGPHDAVNYDLVAVLPGDRRSAGKIVVIDPRPFLRAIPRAFEQNALNLGPSPVLAPGGAGGAALPPCPITAAIELVGGDAVPPTFQPGVRWDEGVPYVDGGVDLTCDRPPPPSSCGPPPST